MSMMDGLLRACQQHTCKHHWVRARWENGTYGLRCARCMAAYVRTWEDVIGTRAGTAGAMSASGGTARLSELRRVA
ncbi:MAG: hypothetical protein ACRD04_06290 [Terriglobales bacterium]